MDGDTGGLVTTPRAGGNGRGTHANRDAGTHRDVHERRTEIVVRLLERGMSVRVLHALLPGWDDAISTGEPAPQGGEPAAAAAPAEGGA